eukprot:symbB.v1.2.030481.t1/scaffold3434.1/size111337/6
MVGTVHLDFKKVLNCEGRDFHPDWSLLHQSLQSGSRLASIQLGTSLVDRWRNRSKSCEVLPGVLLGEVSARQLNGFCPFGFAAALRVASWSVRPLGPGLRKRARELLDEALQCLAMGGRWWTWNFHTDSKWKTLLSPLDLVTARPWRKAISSRPMPSGDSYMEEYEKQLKAAMLYSHGSMPSNWMAPSVPSIVVSAFGVHTTTLLEPIFALRKVLPQVWSCKLLMCCAVVAFSQEMSLVMALFGATHPDPTTLLAEVCPESQWESSKLLCFSSFHPSPDWNDLFNRPVEPALNALGEVIAGDTFLRRTDLLVCGGGGSPTLCLMLRMVTDLPILITLQAPLTFRMPSSHQSLFIGLFREIAKPPVAKEG